MENLTEDQREIAKLETMLDVCRRDKDALRYQLEEAKRKAAEQSMHLTAYRRWLWVSVCVHIVSGFVLLFSVFGGR